MNNSLLLGLLLVIILALSFLGIVLTLSSRARRRHTPPATPVPSQPDHPNPATPSARVQPSLRTLTPPAPSLPVSQQQSNGSYTGTGPLVIPGSMYLLNNRMSHLPSYRIGKQGEDEVVNCITEVLDSRWVLFRNLLLPGENNGDIDIVLVGPGGIYAVEVKTYSGTYVVRDGSWSQIYRDGSEAKLKRGPGAQVRTNAGTLCNFLKRSGIAYKNGVTRVVISAGQGNVHVNSSKTRVWSLDELPQRLADLNKLRILDAQHIRNITNVLKLAAEYSRNRELPATARAN